MAAAAAAAGLALAVGAGGAGAPREGAKNCGIVGVVSSSTEKGPDGGVVDFLHEGLSILRNRGYDSAGVATVDNDRELVVSKFASKGDSADSMELLQTNSANHASHSVGIAHTRWATHGGKTDKNAHPHMDYDNRIALVHNGTINNATELRRELQGKGISFRSETDSEVIAHLIGLEMSANPNMTLKEATGRALARCDGTWGLAILNKADPDNIVVACNGSPMVIGLAQGEIFVASETAAFSRHTKNFIAMKDGEIGVIGTGGCSLDVSRMEKSSHTEDILLSPAPYAHWTIMECLQQPEAIARALAFGGRMSEDRVVLGGFDRSASRLSLVKNLVLAACGTSLYASMYGAKLMRDLEALDTATAMDAGELRLTDIPRRHGGFLAVSQSGETRDLLKALKHAELAGVARMSVVNAVGSAIARETKLGVYLNAGRETAVASTKAFTTQVTVLALVALWFRQVREAELASGEATESVGLPDKSKLFEALQRLPISFGMAMRVRQQCKLVAEKLADKKHIFVLGKGYGEPVAYEGALKLKEMAYIHAEGYSGGALKHGPFALIEGAEGDNGATPIILLILDDDHAHQMRTCGEEVKARGAQLTVITDNPRLADGLDPNPIVIPNNGALTALIAVLPLQFIAYELSLAKGINPDTPRNLAKAVTTD
ncbi:glutamine-fructose-6-phosphate transaminase [Ectocarpus siliculosus]|uniref:Glutamine--fructose-6-phosphate aminotransferase [isomerizing] n=1 Tax=Ectocarpus siliculosus TaxID=2880 RepID=D8LI63_ECTSI|nr:glutamine-fructose-6-phosphate transaminase [Ectocarpus siliculosus]|eukprot:CBN79399.1 glutamine-fructose-6-phosphate transaminase [Ectocarpus siliculosus]